MDWIVIDGVKAYDGRYELDLTNAFSTREWGWVKRLAGYLPGNYEDGLTGLDPELICVFATIAMCRAGKVDGRDVPQVFDRLADAPFGSVIQLDTDTAVEKAEPADPTLPPSSNGNETFSGPVSTTSSGTSVLTPARSGIPVSDPSGSA